jgi:Uma2 family endonuclease
MATAVEPPKTRALEGEQRVVLRDVDWDGYETLLRMVGDGHVRLTYDGEDVELMSPSRDHESYALLIGRIIDTVTEELRIPCQGLRTTTWRKRVKERGLEADNCYYLANLPRIRGKKGKLDLTIDPPPDLAIEVEITHSALDRMSIYAALGIPEVWRFDGEQLTMETLQPNGTYATVAVSPGLPMIAPEEVVRWARSGEAADDHSEWGRQLREWVRAELVPRRQGN